jgi:hypothetical protein
MKWALPPFSGFADSNLFGRATFLIYVSTELLARVFVW